MKKNQKRLGALLLAGSMTLSLLPTAALAEEGDVAPQALDLHAQPASIYALHDYMDNHTGDRGESDVYGENTYYDRIYGYGIDYWNKTNEFRVLDLNYATSDTDPSAKHGALVLENRISPYWDGYYGAPISETNRDPYLSSRIRSYVNGAGGFRSLLTSAESNSTLPVSRTGTDMPIGYYGEYMGALDQDEFFVLSVEEFSDPRYGTHLAANRQTFDYREINEIVNLRSVLRISYADDYNNYQYLPQNKYGVYYPDASYTSFNKMWRSAGALVAFVLDPDKVLFVSRSTDYDPATVDPDDPDPAKPGKAALGEDWASLSEDSTQYWKTTIIDATNYQLDVTNASVSGTSLSFDYDATVPYGATNVYLSAILVDSEGQIYGYKKLADISTTQTGSVSATVPAGYSVKVFAEQCNGEKASDPASAPVLIQNADEKQVSHSWTDWELEQDTLTKTRYCRFCGETEIMTKRETISGVINDNYPWGEAMDSKQIILNSPRSGTNMKVQTSASQYGSWTDVNVEVTATNKAKLTNNELVDGNWYRFVVDGTATEAIRAVQLTSDYKLWCGDEKLDLRLGGNDKYFDFCPSWKNSMWFLSNDRIVYAIYNQGGLYTNFDLFGVYQRDDGTKLWAQTRESINMWLMSTTHETNPGVVSGHTAAGFARLESLPVHFEHKEGEQQDRLVFSPVLGQGQRDFAFSVDMQNGSYMYASYVKGATTNWTQMTWKDSAYVHLQNIIYNDDVDYHDVDRGARNIWYAGSTYADWSNSGNNLSLGVGWKNRDPGDSITFSFQIGKVNEVELEPKNVFFHAGEYGRGADVSYSASRGSKVGQAVDSNHIPMTSLPTFTPVSGWQFAHQWIDAEGHFLTDNEVLATIYTGETTELHFYAVYTMSNAATATFNFAGGTTSSGATNAVYKQMASADPDSTYDVPQPTKAGFDFDQWVVTEYRDGGDNDVADAPAVGTFGNINTSVTYTAKWIAKEYTIKFDANGGDGTMADQKFKFDGSLGVSLKMNEFTKVDGNFVGWAFASNATKPDYREGESSIAAAIGAELRDKLIASADGSVTLYAFWGQDTLANPTITMAFDPAGGIWSDDNTSAAKLQSVIVGETMAVPAAPSKSGCTFKGWISESRFYGDLAADATVSAMAALGKSVTYKAKWVDPNQKWTLTLNANGGTLVSNTVTVSDGTVVDLSQYTPTAPGGMQFEGWYTAQTGGQKVTSVTVEEALTLYARYSDLPAAPTVTGKTASTVTIKGAANTTYDIYDGASKKGTVITDGNGVGTFIGLDKGTEYTIKGGKDDVTVKTSPVDAKEIAETFTSADDTTTHNPTSGKTEKATNSKVEVTVGNDGNYVVKVKDDIDTTVEIPDNWGDVGLDLNGHTIKGDNATATTDARPGVEFVDVGGDGTKLNITDSSTGGKIIGGDGYPTDGKTDGAPGIGANGAPTAPAVKVNAPVSVNGGNGAEGTANTSAGNGGAGIGSGVTSSGDGTVSAGTGGTTYTQPDTPTVTGKTASTVTIKGAANTTYDIYDGGTKKGTVTTDGNGVGTFNNLDKDKEYVIKGGKDDVTVKTSPVDAKDIAEKFTESSDPTTHNPTSGKTEKATNSKVEVTVGDDGNYVVKVKDDIDTTVEIPDNWGDVGLDLNGHTIKGDNATATTDARPGVEFVDANGDGTKLNITDSSTGGKIVGGDGYPADGKTDGAPGIGANGTATAPAVKVNTPASVSGGKGADGTANTSAGNGGAGIGSGVTSSGDGTVSTGTGGTTYTPSTPPATDPAPTPGSGSGSGSDKETSYRIVIADKNPEGGSVSASHSSATAGTMVTITLKADTGYELKELTVTTSTGKTVTVKDKGNGTYTFVMPSSKVTISGSFTTAKGSGNDQNVTDDQPNGNENDNSANAGNDNGDGSGNGYSSCPKNEVCPMAPFPDLVPKSWYHDGVHFCIEENLMRGYNTGLFGPLDDITRAQVVAILWRMEGEPQVTYTLNYNDVPERTWYTEAVRWGTSVGVVEGYGHNAFGPEDSVTREQLATILYRYAANKGYDTEIRGDLQGFADAEQVSKWAVSGLEWAVGCGIINGTNKNELLPKSGTSRAEAAAMFQRFCVNIAKSV